jgi:hypothetical protein
LIVDWAINTSQTCIQRPPLGPEKCGRYAEGCLKVVSKAQTGYYGFGMAVVQRWPLTQVWLYLIFSTFAQDDIRILSVQQRRYFLFQMFKHRWRFNRFYSKCSNTITFQCQVTNTDDIFHFFLLIPRWLDLSWANRFPALLNPAPQNLHCIKKNMLMNLKNAFSGILYVIGVFK